MTSSSDSGRQRALTLVLQSVMGSLAALPTQAWLLVRVTWLLLVVHATEITVRALLRFQAATG